MAVMATAGVLDERTDLTHAGLTAGACRRTASGTRRGGHGRVGKVAFARSRCHRSGRRNDTEVFPQVASGVRPFSAWLGVWVVCHYDPTTGTTWHEPPLPL